MHVRGPEGVRTSRRHHRLLGLPGTLDPDGQALVDGMAEVHWPGAELHIGDAVIHLDSLRTRCPMTTVDPDTLERDGEVLRDIARRFRGRLALNADVTRPGAIHEGDEVHLVMPMTE